MDESKMIDLSRRGDLEAFNLLVLAYQDRVFNQAYRMLGEAQAAEDLTQDAFLIAYRKLRSFKGGSFKAWLLRIATNLSLDELRRRKRRTFVSLEPVNSDGEEFESPAWLADSSESPEEAAERAELAVMMQECLKRLSPKYRAAVTLVDLQEMDYAEAAAALNVSIGTLKSRLSRGRVQMLESWHEFTGRTGMDKPDGKPSRRQIDSHPPNPQTLAVIGYT